MFLKDDWDQKVDSLFFNSFLSVVGDTGTICQTFIKSTRKSACHFPNGHLRKSDPLRLQRLTKWSAVFDVDTHVVLSCLRRVRWGTGLGSLLVRAFDRCCAAFDRCCAAFDRCCAAFDRYCAAFDRYCAAGDEH